MAISSSEISNIISGQVGMFSASAQYAQAISNQYGFQSGGSIGIVDPRNQQQQMALGAGNVGAFGARMPGMAMGAAGMAAMFGYAPRILDPFTATFAAGRMGMTGAGIGGAIGMGAATAGLYYGAAKIGGFMTDNMVTGAQNRGILNHQMGQIFPRMNSQGLNAMASQVESMSRMGMGSIRELAQLMQNGAATGALDTGSLSQFSQSFRKLVGNVRNVANVLNTTLSEANSAMNQVKGMGIRSDQAAAFLGTARGIGSAVGMDTRQMVGVAQAGSNFGFQTGMGRANAARGAMVTAGVYGLAQRNEELGIDGGAQGRYTQAATRFLLSSRGRTVLGAMMNEDGTFNAGAAQMISQGALGKEQLREMYKDNINSASARRMLRSRGTELAGEFISQFGPQAISGSLEAMTTGIDGQSRELLQKSLTGLNRRDIDTMRQLAAYTPQLRNKLVEEARAGFREGQQSVSGMQMMGIAFDRMVKPIRDQFRKMGASMTEAVHGAMEDVTNQMGPQRGFQGQYSDFQNLYQAQNNSLNNNIRGMYTQTGGPTNIFENHMNRMPGRATGYGSFLNYLPGMFRAGALPDGATPMNMPMGGFTTLDPTDAMMVGGVGLALRAGIFPGNRNVVGATGQLMSMTGRQLGRGVDRVFPGSANQGFIRSLGGVGTVQGLSRFPGGMLRFGGMMTRGVGALGRFASPLMIGYGGMGMMSELERLMGRRGFAEGAFEGHNARMLHALRGTGVLGDTHMSLMNVTGGGMSVDQMGGIPVSGLYDSYGAASPTGGHQYALTDEGQTVMADITGMKGRSYSDEARRKLMAANDGVDVMAGLVDRISSTVDPTQRFKLLMDELGGVPGADGMSQQQKAMLIMNTPGALGKRSLDQTRRMIPRVSAAAKGVYKTLQSYSGANTSGTQDARVQELGHVLAGGGNSIHQAFKAFNEGNKERAGDFVHQAIDEGEIQGFDYNNTRGSMLYQDIMGALGGDPNHYMVEAVTKTATDAGVPTFGTQGLAVKEQFDEYSRGLDAMTGISRNIRDKKSSVTNAMRLGQQYLGMYRDAGKDVDSLTEEGNFGAKNQSMRHDIVKHMIGQNIQGNLIGEYALMRAGQEYSRDPTGTGMDHAMTALHTRNALSDYNRAKKKGKKGSNARFLTAQARRMGLDIDFTKYKDADDVAYLSGTKGTTGGEHAISHQLEMDLRSFGSHLYELNNPGKAPNERAALETRNAIMDSLQQAGDSGDQNHLFGAIDRLSSARAPSSPTAGKAAGGGLQQKIGNVDKALDGLIQVIKDKTGELNK